MKLLLLIILLVMSISSSIADDILVVNRDNVLFLPKTEHIRAFIEPGTILKKIDVPYEDRYRGRTRVITPGGIMGEIKSRRFNKLEKISKPLAYLKRPLILGKETFHPGDVFKVDIAESYKGDTYKVIYPSSYYSFKDNAYYVEHEDNKFSEKVFFHNFNLIPESNSIGRFPFWPEKSRESIQWGCENSEEKKTTIKFGAGGNVGGGFSLFKIFRSEVSAEASTEKETTHTQTRKDAEFYHKVSIWVLYESYENRTPILEIALEKTWPCGNKNTHEYNYTLHFHEEKDIDPIVINRVWSEKKKISDGGASPVGLHNMNDYRTFKNALKDFKFYYYKKGYDMNLVLMHFLMRFTANISAD